SHRFLCGKTLGDRYALRLFPISERYLADTRMHRLDGKVYAKLYDCGVRPWTNPVHSAVAIQWGYYSRGMKAEFASDYAGDDRTYLIVMPDDLPKQWVLGALVFHYFGPEGVPFGNGYCFMFAWIHPLFRRNGLMQSAVEAPRNDLGLFYCQTPISQG